MACLSVPWVLTCIYYNPVTKMCLPQLIPVSIIYLVHTCAHWSQHADTNVSVYRKQYSCKTKNKKHLYIRVTHLVCGHSSGRNAKTLRYPTGLFNPAWWDWCWSSTDSFLSTLLEHCFHGNQAAPKFTVNHDARAPKLPSVAQLYNKPSILLSPVHIVSVW